MIGRNRKCLLTGEPCIDQPPGLEMGKTDLAKRVRRGCGAVVPSIGRFSGGGAVFVTVHRHIFR